MEKKTPNVTVWVIDPNMGGCKKCGRTVDRFAPNDSGYCPKCGTALVWPPKETPLVLDDYIEEVTA